MSSHPASCRTRLAARPAVTRPPAALRLRLVAPAAVLAALLGGCVSFAPPRAETLARLAPMALARIVPGRFELELASPGLTGVFDGVCALEARALRVQLFPDVGGKVLDVTVGEQTVRGELPGSVYEAQAPLDSAEPHLALVVALLFAELAAPLAPERVLGERGAPGADGEGIEVALQPALGSGRVTARLGPSGAVVGYRLALGRIELTLDADGRLLGPRLTGWLRPVGDAGG